MPTKEQIFNRERMRLDEPVLYDALLLNDDFTTMDFVVEVLRKVFFKSEDEAIKIMLAVHESGEGVAGTYSYDIAQSKVMLATNMARSAGFPLRLTIKQHL